MIETAFFHWLMDKKGAPRVYQYGAIIEYLGLLGFDITTHRLSEKMLKNYVGVYSHYAWLKWGTHARYKMQIG